MATTRKRKINETVKTKANVPVLMAGYQGAGVSSILKKVCQKQESIELVTSSKVKDDDYNITFNVWKTHPDLFRLPLWTSCLNQSEAMIFVIDSCDGKPNIVVKLDKLSALLGGEKLDKRPCPLLIWLNKQDRDDAITLSEFRKLFSKGLKYQLKKRLYSIKPVSILKPETLRRGFTWLAFEYQKAAEKKKVKEDKEEVQKLRVFMAGLENVGKSTILANMLLMEDTKFWKDFSFLRMKLYKTIYEVWKVPGQEVESRLWKYELKGTQILIFVVDYVDGVETHFEQTFDELRHLLNIEELSTVPLLIFFNKMDIFNHWFLFNKLLTEKLETELQNRAYYVQPCVATRKEGLTGGFRMLDSLKKQQDVRGNQVGSAYKNNKLKKKRSKIALH